jgi:predicted XRE-type DNA-binding protein
MVCALTFSGMENFQRASIERQGTGEAAKPRKTEVFDSVWDAIEDDPGIRENLKLRSELIFALTQHIKREGLTQVQAAKLLGATQPRISNLMRGKINSFGLDMLVQMAVAAGPRVSMKVKRAA